MMKRLILFALPALMSIGCGGKENEPVVTTVAVTGITVTPQTKTLEPGQTVRLTAVVAPEGATNTNHTWRSETPAIATVDPATGLVTAGTTEGTVKIIATSEDGGFEDFCTVTVEEAEVGIRVTEVTLDKKLGFLLAGENLQLAATVWPEDATDSGVKWTSDDSAVTVDQTGLLTAVEIGSAIITVTTDDGGFEATCEVTVNKIGTTGFLTAEVWEVGGYVWSDVVMASGARGKESFGGGSSGAYAVDVRENTGYGDMFTFEAARKYAAQLCPEPWAVPTQDDFIALDKALGGTGVSQSNATLFEAYKTTWNAQMSGLAVGSNGSIARQTTNGYYWSQTAVDTDFGYALMLDSSSNTVNPQATTLTKAQGFPVRCIKPIIEE